MLEATIRAAMAIAMLQAMAAMEAMRIAPQVGAGAVRFMLAVTAASFLLMKGPDRCWRCGRGYTAAFRPEVMRRRVTVP